MKHKRKEKHLTGPSTATTANAHDSWIHDCSVTCNPLLQYSQQPSIPLSSNRYPPKLAHANLPITLIPHRGPPEEPYPSMQSSKIWPCVLSVHTQLTTGAQKGCWRTARRRAFINAPLRVRHHATGANVTFLCRRTERLRLLFFIPKPKVRAVF